MVPLLGPSAAAAIIALPPKLGPLLAISVLLEIPRPLKRLRSS
jgi:hypothetical protein